MDWSKHAGNLDVTGWGHAEIPLSGLALWLKADSLDLNNDDAVSAWKDLSTNGHNFTQATGSAKPTFKTNDADWNNQPYLSFDGNDKLELAYSSTLNTNQFTLFVVSTVNSDDNTHHTIIENTGAGANANKGFVFRAVTTSNAGNNDMYQMRTGTGGSSPTLTTQNTPTNSLVANTPAITSFILSGGDGAGATASKKLFHNGVISSVTGTYAGDLNAAYHKSPDDDYDIGNGPSYQLTGQLGEVIQYNRALTVQERKAVEDYLSTKYNITLSRDKISSSNPYQDKDHDPTLENINYTDSNIQFLYRPAFGLDYKHSQMFRPYVALKGGSPQINSNFYRATSGGKYGMFTSDAPSARTGTPSSPPYAPVYTVDPDFGTTVPVSQGPNIPGVDVTGYDKTDIRSPVARMVMSENTLEHFRADASRRSIDDEEGDYEVQPRFSQTLHPKGSDGDASYNTGDHSGE